MNMNRKDFAIVNKYLACEQFGYIIMRKNSLNKDFNLYEKVKPLAERGLAIHSNVNLMSPTCIPLQNIPHPKKGNSIIVVKEALLSVLNGIVDLDYLIARGYVFVKNKKSIDAQQARKKEKTESKEIKKSKLNNNIKAIKDGKGKTLSSKDWIKANEFVLKSKSTKYENIVFESLKKSLKKRVKRQTPFTINGNVYFADICIKSKNIIIEVDGGYHNMESVKHRDKRRDDGFSSIGYTTFRIKNEDVMNPVFLSDFIKNIINR